MSPKVEDAEWLEVWLRHGGQHMPQAASSSSPRHRLVAFHREHGIIDARTPQPARPTPGSCPLYVTMGRESAGGARTPARLALVPRPDRYTKVLGPDGRPAAAYVNIPPDPGAPERPEPRHPAVRLLGLVCVLALVALLWQFGQLLERDGAFSTATPGYSEVAR